MVKGHETRKARKNHPMQVESTPVMYKYFIPVLLMLK